MKAAPPLVVNFEDLREDLNRKLLQSGKPVSLDSARESFDRVMRFVEDLTGQGYDVGVNVTFTLKIEAP